MAKVVFGISLEFGKPSIWVWLPFKWDDEQQQQYQPSWDKKKWKEKKETRTPDMSTSEWNAMCVIRLNSRIRVTQEWYGKRWNGWKKGTLKNGQKEEEDVENNIRTYYICKTNFSATVLFMCAYESWARTHNLHINQFNMVIINDGNYH